MAQAPIPISFGDEPKVEKIYNMDHGKLVDLTPEAVDKVKEFLKNPKASGKTLRLTVEGGGCSGLQYGFLFDEPKSDDNRVPCGDVEVLIDGPSLFYVKGSVVDYVENVNGTGFIVKNPQSKGECGCGVSFTV